MTNTTTPSPQPHPLPPHLHLHLSGNPCSRSPFYPSRCLSQNQCQARNPSSPTIPPPARTPSQSLIRHNTNQLRYSITAISRNTSASSAHGPPSRPVSMNSTLYHSGSINRGSFHQVNGGRYSQDGESIISGVSVHSGYSGMTGLSSAETLRGDLE